MRFYDFSFNFVTYAMIICFSKMTSGICCDVQRITQPLAKTTNKGRPLFFSILEYTHEWKPINLTKDVLSWNFILKCQVFNWEDQFLLNIKCVLRLVTDLWVAKHVQPFRSKSLQIKYYDVFWGFQCLNFNKIIFNSSQVTSVQFEGSFSI